MPTLRTPAAEGIRVRRSWPGYRVLEWGFDQDVIGRRTGTGIGGPIRGKSGFQPLIVAVNFEQPSKRSAMRWHNSWLMVRDYLG